MPRRVLRWMMWIIGGLFAVVMVAILIAFVISELRMRQTYDVTVTAIAIPTDEASLAWGEHLATTWGLCTECHGEDLSGQVMFDDSFAVIVADNLTRGEGGVAELYTDEDWVRAIRHGVKPQGRSILLMDAALNRLTDQELGAILAYVKSVPPVDKVLPSSRIKIPGRMFVLMEPAFVFTAYGIDHDAARPQDVPPGETAAYGEHIARGTCDQCHRENFAGGEPFELEDGTILLSRNLTPAGNLAHWTEQDFFTTIRTGVTPEEYTLNDEVMPWSLIADLTDEELRAIWLFLQTLPPAEPAPG